MDQSETPTEILIQIVKEKHLMVREILEENNIDAWLIFLRESDANPDPVQSLVIGGEIVWASAFIFFNRDDNYHKIALVGKYDVDAEKAKGIWDQVIGYDEGISNKLNEIITNFNPNKIALNYSLDSVMSDGLSHGLFLKLKKILNNYEDRFISAASIIQPLRSRKTEAELKLIIESAKVTEEINAEMTNLFKNGMSEIDIQNIYHSKVDARGLKSSWQKVSCPAVDAGPDKQMGHIGPSELKIQKGHTLHNDFGVKRYGYCSDIQRMWFFGKPDQLPDELRHAFDTVRDAITKAFGMVKPGISGFEVDKVAREYVISQGYKQYMHATGHQVGTKAHDGGALLGPRWESYGTLPDIKLEKSNVFTLELHVITDNYGGVSLEEMIVITDNGAEFIVPRQSDFICVDI